MIYLLDVNALVALGFVNHEFHDRVVSWIRLDSFASLRDEILSASSRLPGSVFQR